MGVKDLMRPYIRDDASAVNTNLKSLMVTNGLKEVGGFDMSVVIIQVLSTTSKIQSMFHQDPRVPLKDLNDKGIQIIKKYFDHGMDKAVLSYLPFINLLPVS